MNKENHLEFKNKSEMAQPVLDKLELTYAPLSN